MEVVEVELRDAYAFGVAYTAVLQMFTERVNLRTFSKFVKINGLLDLFLLVKVSVQA